MSRVDLRRFVNEAWEMFNAQPHGINWDDDDWDTTDWFDERRGKAVRNLPFRVFGNKKNRPVLEQPFRDFAKATVVHFKAESGNKYEACKMVLIAAKRLYHKMAEQNLSDPCELTQWHFNEIMDDLVRDGYQNLFDAGCYMAVVANLMDRFAITDDPICFVNPIKPPNNDRLNVSATPAEAGLGNGEAEKMPSRKAMEAYAVCTNNPVSDAEEILLRTLDLLMAMGQRATEASVMPYDCWVRKELVGDDGQPVMDPITQEPIYVYGIRYYPEKNMDLKINWLADQDVPLAERAVTRLKELTAEARAVASWQEAHPGRLWDKDPDAELHEDEVIKYVGAKKPQNLFVALQRQGVKPVRHEDVGHRFVRYYRAGDVEDAYRDKLEDHVAFVFNGKPVLKKSEVLSLKFVGQFRFRERSDSVNKLLPEVVSRRDMAYALGMEPRRESVFERDGRGYTEADGSRIVMSTHSPRHWRNTLYKLMGLTNIQQAKAMLRKDWTQNPRYWHVTLEEQSRHQHSFVEFRTRADKARFLRQGIEKGTIYGPLADTYNKLVVVNKQSAMDFLLTHAGGIHVTLWGVCTNDFSRRPCEKHIQCFDDCSHLHRTDDPREEKNLRALIERSEAALGQMKAEADGEAGSDKWIEDLERKIVGMKKALALNVKLGAIPVKVFPDGAPKTIPNSQRRQSSVRDDSKRDGE